MGLLLLSILTVLTITVFTGTLNESRYAETIRRMKVLRKGLVGETQFRNGLTRGSFGYNGDMGGIPNATQGLGALTTNPGSTAWTMNSTTRIPYGWSTGYLDSGDSTESFATDAWGTAFGYAPTATPPTITSLAADRAAGGTGYNKDIVMQIPDSSRISTVYGVILQSGNQYNGTADIDLYAPDGNGGQKIFQTSIAAGTFGKFSIAGVPQGVRSAKIFVPNRTTPTKTVGPSVFVVDRPHYLINTRFFDIGTSVGPTNLEFPIEMLDYGVGTPLAVLTTFVRSYTPLTTTDYDGTVSYSFEIVANNPTLAPVTVSLTNNSGVYVSNITVPAGTNNPTRFRVAFTPTAGANGYQITLPIVLLNTVNVYAARIFVKQVGASKTNIYVPLTAFDATTTSAVTTAYIDSTGSTSYTQGNPLYYSSWKKDLSKLSIATGTPYTFTAVLSTGLPLVGVTSAALYNRTSNSFVGGAAVSVAGLGLALLPTFASASFADNATNFDDLSEFDVRIKGSVLNTGYIAKAGLWIKLANLGSGEAYYRTAMSSTGTGTQTFDEQRQLLTLGNFSNPAVYSESMGFTATAGTPAFTQLDALLTESGTAGAAVSGASTIFTSSKARARSGVISPVSGDRFLGTVINSSSSNTSFSSGQMIVQFHY